MAGLLSWVSFYGRGLWLSLIYNLDRASHSRYRTPPSSHPSCSRGDWISSSLLIMKSDTCLPVPSASSLNGGRWPSCTLRMLWSHIEESLIRQAVVIGPLTLRCRVLSSSAASRHHVSLRVVKNTLSGDHVHEETWWFASVHYWCCTSCSF